MDAEKNNNDIATTQAADPVVKTEVKDVKKEKRSIEKIISKKLKENKIFYYGFPVFVVMMIFAGLLLFILPTIQYYFTSREEEKTLDQNIINVNQSIQNLNLAKQDDGMISAYDAALTEYIPVDSKLGGVLNVIQTKAKDFNLESQIGISKGSNTTSIDNIAKKDEDDKALFESISSGELTFSPRSLNKDINAILLSIEVNVKGDKNSFMQFLQEMKDVKPLINVVYIEYNETNAADGKSTINAIVKFEAYALKLNTDSVKINSAKQVTKDDSSLTRNIPIEKFLWDKSIGALLKL